MRDASILPAPPASLEVWGEEVMVRTETPYDSPVLNFVLWGLKEMPYFDGLDLKQVCESIFS
jgi:hypothetical protein